MLFEQEVAERQVVIDVREHRVLRVEPELGVKLRHGVLRPPTAPAT
jgi:hypothetical protein